MGRKIPKFIYIAADKVKIKISKRLPYQGCYCCTTRIIELNPKDKDIGAVLLHEIMEYIAASFYGIWFEKKSGVRHIELIHEPKQSKDNWCMYVELIVDTIRRNKLQWIFKEV
jgi:hypothetical protein